MPSICRPARDHHSLGPCQTNALFCDLLSRIEACYPTGRYRRLSIAVDNDSIHQAKDLEPWLAAHLRFTRLWLPTYAHRTKPVEHAFGDVHDGCTRHHHGQHRPNLVADVEDHLHLNGPWKYQLSDLYAEPAVTAAVARIAAKESAVAAA